MAAAGDERSGLDWLGGGWHGMIKVTVSAVGEEDWVRVVMVDNPEVDVTSSAHCTELYAGPLDAGLVAAEKKRLRKRRAQVAAREMLRERLAKSNTAIVHELSEEDPFYLDESEVRDGYA